MFCFISLVVATCFLLLILWVIDGFPKPFEAAVMRGDRARVNRMLASRPKRINDRQALWNALNPDRIEILSLLLERGANANCRRQDGHGPLSWAAGGGDANLNIVELLLKHGVSVAGKQGAAALTEAAHRSPQIFELLLARGADPNQVLPEDIAKAAYCKTTFPEDIERATNLIAAAQRRSDNKS